MRTRKFRAAFGVAFALMAVASIAGPVFAEDTTGTVISGDAENQVVLYYFHGNRRCNTCRTIESQALDVVESRFAKLLRSGELAWRVVNYDEPENLHFMEDFGLVSASLVLVEMNEGKPVRFEVLQKAWTLVRDKPGFDSYVLHAIDGYLS